MSKYLRNSGKPWTSADRVLLRELLRNPETPLRIIALKLARTKRAVRSFAVREGIRLTPRTRAAYGTKRAQASPGALSD